jgi:adenosylhomocysteine nucleosidase
MTAQNMNDIRIGIIGAMPEEIAGIADILDERKETQHGGRIYYTGILYGIKAVLVFSRWGKVAAATTVTTLILEFKISHVYFTGVAGALSPALRVGDVVVATRLIQHDMDARPLIPQYEIPLLGKTYFETDLQQYKLCTNAVNNVFNNLALHQAISTEDLTIFNIKQPSLHTGDIASGDKFIARKSQQFALTTSLPNVLCVEMEGAAVAQVCYEYNIPFSIIRTISDSADEQAHFDFPNFIKKVAGVYSLLIIKNIFAQLANNTAKP